MSAWFEYFGNVAIGVATLLWLFEGSRRLVLHGVRKDAIKMLIGGLAFSLMIGGISYWKHRMTLDVIETLKRPVFAKHLPLPDDWGGRCCKETREAETRKLVQAAFVESGRLHEYIDASGKRALYAPSKDDIKVRDARVVADARLEDASHNRLSDVVYTIIASVLSMLIGTGVGRAQRKASTSSTAESDAKVPPS